MVNPGQLSNQLLYMHHHPHHARIKGDDRPPPRGVSGKVRSFGERSGHHDPHVRTNFVLSPEDRTNHQRLIDIRSTYSGGQSFGAPGLIRIINWIDSSLPTFSPTITNVALYTLSYCLRNESKSEIALLASHDAAIEKLLDRCRSQSKDMNSREVGEIWMSLAGINEYLEPVIPTISGRIVEIARYFAIRTKQILPDFDTRSLGAVASGIVEMRFNDRTLAERLLNRAQIELHGNEAQFDGLTLTRLFRLCGQQREPFVEFVVAASERVERLLQTQDLALSSMVTIARAATDCGRGMVAIRDSLDPDHPRRAEVETAIVGVRILTCNLINILMNTPDELTFFQLSQSCRTVEMGFIGDHRLAVEAGRCFSERIADRLDQFRSEVGEHPNSDTQIELILECVRRALNTCRALHFTSTKLLEATLRFVTQYSGSISSASASRLASPLVKSDLVSFEISKILDLRIGSGEASTTNGRYSGENGTADATDRDHL